MFRHVTVSRRGQPAIYDAVADGVGRCRAEVRDAPSGNLSIALCAHVLQCRQPRARTPAQELQTGAECFCFALESRLSMAMCTVVQAGLDAPCHCYTRLRALTASRLHRATMPSKLLQAYCKSCMQCPTQHALSFAATLETFQAGSRQRLHSTQRPNRRVEHHMYTVSHREMVAFFAQYTGLKQKSRILGRDSLPSAHHA